MSDRNAGPGWWGRLLLCAVLLIIVQQRLGKLDLVVGTPGRLNDMLRDQTIRTKNVRHLVLDEAIACSTCSQQEGCRDAGHSRRCEQADRMLDMGFEPQLREIVDHLPADGGRQTFMFSATWPSEARKLKDEKTTVFGSMNQYH